LYGSVDRGCLEQGNSIDTERRLVAAGKGELVVTAEGTGFLLGLIKMF